MKTYNIILFIVLQGFISVIFSQEIRDGFKILRENQRVVFEDLSWNNYRGYPLNKKGEDLFNPSSRFSSIEKLKRIENALFSEQERNSMRINYRPRAMIKVRASDGKIVATIFYFENLQDPSVIDTKKLKKLNERVKEELMIENLLFNGEKAASGYIAGHIWFFKF
ncbi:hypothetical protein SDC9_155455 [bioreactor metagenome]|uniref:Uncharacterized protein n=1 Tax=bioreactor metagenome TaxID=1076179 RepID=A0A645F1J0_9ZZZZ